MLPFNDNVKRAKIFDSISTRSEREPISLSSSSYPRGNAPHRNAINYFLKIRSTLEVKKLVHDMNCHLSVRLGNAAIVKGDLHFV